MSIKIEQVEMSGRTSYYVVDLQVSGDGPTYEATCVVMIQFDTNPDYTEYTIASSNPPKFDYQPHLNEILQCVMVKEAQEEAAICKT